MQVDLDAAGGVLFERDVQIGTNVASGPSGLAASRPLSFC
jgi:hypothetical protein